MNKSEDYYATLGVLPSAEEVVIRAAYKALAQRYHPDRFEGAKDESLRRMQEINKAYSVLSDPVQRDEYDRLRGTKTQSGESYFDEDANDVPPRYDPLEKDWAFAVKYYPDLSDIEARLVRIAWRLGYSFRAYILDQKVFEQREQVAASMERKFLELYFGTNQKIVDFAKELINNGHKKPAKALNEAVRILGNNVDPTRVIDQIRKEFMTAPSPSFGYRNYDPFSKPK